jgi:hypothetical protein
MTRPSVSDERGLALVIVIAMVALLGAISVGMLDVMTSETQRSAQATKRDAALQAAEAGLNDYISKLIEDNAYYFHTVHPNEVSRKSANGTVFAGGSSWNGELTWTYATSRSACNCWKQLPNGYDYSLKVSPPTQASPGVMITSVGRPHNDSNTGDWRALQASVRPSSVSDFQMMSNADISYGSTATTNGKIYAGIDSSGTKHNINHSGTASQNLYAEGSVTGTVNMTNGAQKYNSTNIRSVIPSPISFSSFLVSLTNLQLHAQNGGIYLNDTTKSIWKIVFSSAGTFTAQGCTPTNGSDVEQVAPTCGTATTYNVPVNGAVYSPQSVMVSGTVKGRVTIGSNNDVVIGDNISYVQGGQDVLGLVAQNDVVVAYYAPTNLTWWAAAIAETGQFISYNNDGSHGTMTFNGGVATNKGGSMSMFTTRVYNYDPNLLFLSPPWFPTVGDAYTVLMEREIPAAGA